MYIGNGLLRASIKVSLENLYRIDYAAANGNQAKGLTMYKYGALRLKAHNILIKENSI